MRSWAGPDVPRLPGRGSLPSVVDTATGERATVGGTTARMYVCGITPYDATHLGHAATYLTFDLLGRVWRDAGADVHYVQNVTDVDDPLIARAAATGEPWEALADREIELFRTDMAALRIIPPEDYLGAVETISLVVDAVEQLRAKDAVYAVNEDLYFDVGRDPDFGTVGHLDRDAMLALFAERGGDPARAGKRDPLDCLLWQGERPNDPAWDSALGRGRPGWHIECTAIARAYLGPTFDVQGGGRDLVFPHHEMCAAQGHVLDGAPFAQAYVHAGMVGLDGAKMSKSKGNLVLVSTLLERGVDPMAIRLALLAHHYRSDWSWTDADLAQAEARLARWRDAVAHASTEGGEALLAEIRRALADDLDAPAALAAVDAWAASGASGTDLVRAAVDALLGVAL